MADRCEYCHEDSDGGIRPFDKNGHAYIRYNWLTHEQEMQIRLGGKIKFVEINCCPMCGRKLNDG